jgi:hypothetical protein
MFLVLTGAHYGLAEWSNLSRLVVACLTGFVAYAAVLLAWPKARAEAGVLLSVLHLLRQRIRLNSTTG